MKTVNNGIPKGKHRQTSSHVDNIILDLSKIKNKLSQYMNNATMLDVKGVVGNQT
jgi:hypothetical protein